MASIRSALPSLGVLATLLVPFLATSTGCRLSRPATVEPPSTGAGDRGAPASPRGSATEPQRSGAANGTGPARERERLEGAREDLRADDPTTRVEGVWTARELGASADTLVDPLLAALADDDESVRCAVIRSISEVSAEPSRIVPALLDVALNDPSQRVRSRAVGAIGKLGPGTIEVVLDHLPVDDRRARAVAARIVRDVVRARPAALATVARVLVDEDPLLRETAAWALWDLGAEAAPAMEALLAALGDDDENVRFYASWALGRMGAGAVPALVTELASDDRRVRSAAAIALGGIGAEALAAVEPLRRLLEDDDPAVRASVQQALARIQAASNGQA